MKNIFTIDTEDWFHANYEDGLFQNSADVKSTVEENTEVYLRILEQYHATATFFVLGQYRTTATIRITGRPFCKNQLGRPCFCSQERTDSSCQAGPVSQNQIR